MIYIFTKLSSGGSIGDTDHNYLLMLTTINIVKKEQLNTEVVIIKKDIG